MALLYAVWASHAAVVKASSPTTVALEYDVASDVEDCPSVDEFRSRVIRQLNYDPFQRTADRRVAVHIARKGSGFDGWIKWSDARGRWVGDRRLSSVRPDCEEIAASVAFAVAVQIQLLATLQSDSSTRANGEGSGGPLASSAPKSDATTPAATDATAQPSNTGGSNAKPSGVVKTTRAPDAKSDAGAPESESEAADAARRGLRWFAGLGPSLALGLAPHLVPAGRVFVGGRLTAFSVQLGFGAAWPAKRRQPDGSGFSFSRFGVGVVACGHVQVLAACVTGSLDRVGARGLRLDKPASPSGLSSQLGARVTASQELAGRYFVTMHIDALLMLSKWSVQLDDVVVWTTPRTAAEAGADFGVFF